MIRSRLARRRRRLFEDVPATLPIPETGTEEAKTPENDNNEEQPIDDTEEESKAPFTADDVKKMTDGEIINYVYVSVPENIDAMTKQALLQRADELRRKADAGQDIEQRAKQILRSVRSTVDLNS